MSWFSLLWYSLEQPALARLVGQPAVIGEIAVGLAIGPVLLPTVGRKSFDALLPNPTVQTLQLIGLAGLVLFLVGVTHEINAPRQTGWFRTVSFVGFGSFVPSS